MLVKEYIIKYQFKLEALTKTCNRINNIIIEWQSIIENIMDKEDKNQEQELFESFTKQNELLEIIQTAEEVLVNGNEFMALAELTKSQLTCNVDPTEATQLPSRSKNVFLPRIEHPRFSGKSEDWFQFYEYFMQTVHNDESLTDIEKLTYLIGVLDGEAKDSVKNFYIRACNYEIVLNLLRNKFGREEIIIEDLLHKLNSIRLNETSISSVKTYVNDMYETYQQLKQVGKEVGEHQFIIMIERKLHILFSKNP